MLLVRAFEGGGLIDASRVGEIHVCGDGGADFVVELSDKNGIVFDGSQPYDSILEADAAMLAAGERINSARMHYAALLGGNLLTEDSMRVGAFFDFPKPKESLHV